MIDEFVRQWVEKVYPGDWEEFAGVATIIKHDGVGIYISSIPGEGKITFAAGVLSGLTLSAELTKEVGSLNQSTAIGGIYLSPGQTSWQLIYVCKVLKGWIDPSSNASQQMMLDILSNMPKLVRIRAAHISERVDRSTEWSLEDGWQVALLGHL